MNIKKLEAVVEAILFTMGEAVEIERLAAAVEHDEDTVRKIKILERSHQTKHRKIIKQYQNDGGRQKHQI